MGKILITGMNKAQTTFDYWRRQELKVIPSHYSLIRCLEDMGHAVEHRHVEIGEDISGYDRVICYVHTPKAYAQRLFNGLYAAQAREDVIFAVDDWQVDQILGHLDNFYDAFFTRRATSTHEYILSLHEGGYKIDEILANQEMYRRALDVIIAKKNKLLISAFAGGDVSLLKSGWEPKDIYTFNPNPYHYNRRPDNHFLGESVKLGFGDSDLKVREWNFASLVQNKTRSWFKKIDPKWPVNYYGSRRGEFKSERKTEDEMCRVFSQQWGSLVPSYYHAGSGWWRARPLQVADAGSIMVCQSDRENAVYGDAYVGVTVDKVEGLDEAGLTALAKAQRDCLYEKHPLDKKVEQEELAKVLA